MTDEIELKFIEIDVDLVISKLEKIGAKKIYDRVFKATAFDGLGFSSKSSAMKYLRIRDDGNNVFLTYKSPSKDSKVHIRDEIEVNVSDFDKCVEIISKTGLIPGPILNKHRIHYEIDDFENMGKVCFEIDEYDTVPTLLEIEVSDIKQMEKICDLLELDMSSGKKEMITEIYPEILNR